MAVLAFLHSSSARCGRGRHVRGCRFHEGGICPVTDEWGPEPYPLVDEDPPSFDLVDARTLVIEYDKEDSYWVADCPAIGMSGTGATKHEALIHLQLAIAFEAGNDSEFRRRVTDNHDDAA